MKKYLFWVLAISILFGWYSFAACTEGDDWYPDCLWGGWGSQSSSSICDRFTDDKEKSKCLACKIQQWQWVDWYWWECSQSYSCESLFTDSTTANNCNLARCKKQRWDKSSYCECKYVKKWIPLNTSIPFLWNCLEKSGWGPNDTAALNAFPTIVSVATRILVTVIMLAWFIMIIVWWVQWSAWNAKEWRAMIKKVAIWFALLWAMWAILRLINPNFFK